MTKIQKIKSKKILLKNITTGGKEVCAHIKLTLLLRKMKNKPKKCCYPNCENCPYVDCRYDNITNEEISMQDDYDKEINSDIQRMRAISNNTLHFYKYNHSEKGKQRAKKYRQSEKGKANAKKRQQKCIADGRNAKACKKYYYKKKAEKELLKLKQA